jgi:hypothetical protein
MIYVINTFFSASICNDLKSIVFKRWSRNVPSRCFRSGPVSVIYKYSRIIFGKIVMTSPHTTTSPEMIRIIYINLRCRHRLWLGTIPKMVFFQIGELLYLSRTMSWTYLGTIVFCPSHVGMALWIGWPHETIHGALHLSWYYLDNHICFFQGSDNWSKNVPRSEARMCSLNSTQQGWWWFQI